MTATYETDNVKFLYPENWQVSVAEEDERGEYRQITLETPAGGLWMLYVFPAGTEGTQPLGEIREAFDQQYADIEWSEVDEPFQGFQCHGLDGFFYSLDFLIGVRLRCFQALAQTFIVAIQAENQDLDRMLPVYDAVTLSLLRASGNASVGG